jgi:hypothetical protein
MKRALFLLLISALFTRSLQAGTLEVRQAYLDVKTSESKTSNNKTLVVNLNFQPSATVIEALEASLPLQFTLAQQTPNGISSDTIVLRYAPLFERFELLTEPAVKLGLSHSSSVRPYRLRAELLDAFSALRLPAAPGVTAVRLSLNIGDLPGPLRLPALFNPDWWLDSGWVDMCVDCFAEPLNFAPAQVRP